MEIEAAQLEVLLACLEKPPEWIHTSQSSIKYHQKIVPHGGILNHVPLITSFDPTKNDFISWDQVMWENTQLTMIYEVKTHMNR